MRKAFYSLIIFIIAYLAILSGSLLYAFFAYQDNGYFSLTRKDFLFPIKPAIIALLIHFLITKILPSNKGDAKK